MNKRLILTIISLLVLLLAGFLFQLNEAEAPEAGLPEDNPSQDEEQTKPEKNLPEVAIIIDDLGNNFAVEKKLKDVDAKLTLAVLPFRSNTQKAVNYFTQKELILHLPLEPMESKYFEEKMIMTDMSNNQIKTEFTDYFNELDGKVTGINNHKGSRFTSDERAMRSLLQAVKEKNLYFVDSYTKASSVGYKLAKEMDILTAKRNIFLDNSKEKEAIEEQIEKLVVEAKEEGSAVGIGHAHPNTISVLNQKLPQFKEEVNFVSASEIVK